MEFNYRGSRYSITYPKMNGTRKFCLRKFYEKPVYVDNAYDALKPKIGNRTIEGIFSKFPDSAFDNY